MKDFDWVAARAACSLPKVFQQLKLEIEADVKARNEKRGENPYYEFSLIAKNGNLVILVSGNNLPQKTVTIKLTTKGISVHDTDDDFMFEATLTLNNEGECRLKIDNQERDFWQFRRMALEDIFFEGL